MAKPFNSRTKRIDVSVALYALNIYFLDRELPDVQMSLLCNRFLYTWMWFQKNMYMHLSK